MKFENLTSFQKEKILKIKNLLMHSTKEIHKEFKKDKISKETGEKIVEAYTYLLNGLQKSNIIFDFACVGELVDDLNEEVIIGQKIVIKIAFSIPLSEYEEYMEFYYNA